MVATKDDFKKLIDDISSIDGYREPIGFGIARVDRGQKSRDKYYKHLSLACKLGRKFWKWSYLYKCTKDSGVAAI